MRVRKDLNTEEFVWTNVFGLCVHIFQMYDSNPGNQDK